MSNLLWPWVMKTLGFSSQSESKKKKNIPLWTAHRLRSTLTRPQQWICKCEMSWHDTKLVSGVIIHIYKNDGAVSIYCRYCDYKDHLRSVKVIAVFVRNWCANGNSDVFLVSSSCRRSCTRWSKLWEKERMGGLPFMSSPDFANAAWW